MLILVRRYFKDAAKFGRDYCHKRYHSQTSLICLSEGCCYILLKAPKRLSSYLCELQKAALSFCVQMGPSGNEY